MKNIKCNNQIWFFFRKSIYQNTTNDALCVCNFLIYSLWNSAMTDSFVYIYTSLLFILFLLGKFQELDCWNEGYMCYEFQQKMKDFLHIFYNSLWDYSFHSDSFDVRCYNYYLINIFLTSLKIEHIFILLADT
jgi:hypothetical protein